MCSSFLWLVPLFVRGIIEFTQGLLRKTMRSINFVLRYTDDVLLLNNSRLGDFVDRIYPIDLEMKDTTDTARSASYLDLLLKIDREGWLRTKLYDKRCDFIFPIVNIPFICIWSTVYISQLIWYFRVCGSYHDFLNKGLLLTRKLLNQGFLVNMLKLSLQNLYGHYHDLVNRYSIYMCLKWPQVCSIVVIIIINAKVIEEPQI